MPVNASRSAVIFYDQFEDDQRFADWGADELFTRMPRRGQRVVDQPRAPRPPAVGEPRAPRLPAPARRAARYTRPSGGSRARALELVEPPRRARAPGGVASAAPIEPLRPRRPYGGHASGALHEPPPAGRPTKVVTGHPGAMPRPLPIVPSPRRRPARSVADWIGARPERIVAWAFVLGLLLVLIAISTADAAPL